MKRKAFFNTLNLIVAVLALPFRSVGFISNFAVTTTRLGWNEFECLIDKIIRAEDGK